MLDLESVPESTHESVSELVAALDLESVQKSDRVSVWELVPVWDSVSVHLLDVVLVSWLEPVLEIQLVQQESWTKRNMSPGLHTLKPNGFYVFITGFETKLRTSLS